ncbi:MAG: divalent-cation tolerance protein CutA [bacterium]
MNTKHYILILTTTPTKEEGERIGEILVTEKKAACVSIIPNLSSTFSYEGKIETSSEAQLLIKTKRKLFSDVASLIKANHSYEIPEIIALPIIDGSSSYLKWIDESLK